MKVSKIWFEFPSPYGVTVIKSGIVTVSYVLNLLFPSPYGVTVIKSNIDDYYDVSYFLGFRPLTG